MKLLFPILCLLPRIRDKPTNQHVSKTGSSATDLHPNTTVKLPPTPSITVPSSVYLIVDLMRTLPLPSITVPSSVYLTVYLMRTTPPSITVPSSVYLTLDLTGTHGRCHNTLSPLNSSFKWLQTANLFITTQIMRLNHRLKIPGLYEPEIYCFRCYLYLLPISPDWLCSYCPIVHFNTMLPTSTFCFHYPQSFPELRIDFFFFSVFVIFFLREILTF